MVRLGQPLHSGDSRTFRERRFTRSGQRRNCATVRDAGEDRVNRAEGGSHFLHLARCTVLLRVGRQRDGKVLSFHLLFRVTAVRRALGQQKPGDISVLLDDAFALAKRLNAYNFGAELAR